MKQCIQCQNNYELSKFVKGKQICKECYSVTPRACNGCNTVKQPTDFEPQRQQCRECRKNKQVVRDANKEKVVPTKSCDKCKLEKPSTMEFFPRGYNVCRLCFEKSTVKTCIKCNIEKDVTEYKTNAAICKVCYNVKRMNDNKEKYKISCIHCKNTFNKISMFSDTICKNCRNILDRECIDCKQVKPVSEFRNNLCKKCISQRVMACNKDKSTTKICEFCSLEKDKKEFTRNHGNACDECYKIIPRPCKICNEVRESSEYRDTFRHVCIICEREQNNNYRKQNPSTWAIENPERMKELQHDYYNKNKNQIRENENNRYFYDVKYNFYQKEKTTWKKEIKNYKYSEHNINIFIEWLKYNDVDLKNYGTLWNIDHIIPCSYYYATREDVDDEFKLVFNWRNTRPTNPQFNMAKKSKLSLECYQNQKEKVLQFCKEYFPDLLDDSIKYFETMDTLLVKFNKQFENITSLLNNIEMPSTGGVKSVLSPSATSPTN